MHIRANRGDQGYDILIGLYDAVSSGTRATVDGVMVPDDLTATSVDRDEVRQWLWRVILADGARALIAAGHWSKALAHVQRHQGVGERMLDGRQVTVIAHAIAGRHHLARQMLDTTQPGEPWENAVTASLHLHVADSVPADLATAALTAHHALGPGQTGLAVFRTRLGLTLIDGLGADNPDYGQLVKHLLRDAANDGYAARDVLAHPGCLGRATAQQVDCLTELVASCGLRSRSLTQELRATLDRALDTAEAVITQQVHTQPQQLA
ncbi:hypothetical protein [Nocardioides speluncae]|uniref:hypothetical protein n=1 Tax=Nocardioides speluncae TaxID=2670337 RepID=UPI00197EFA47|nr:hypothetical protein [Nocardioides speluncae]